MRDSRKKEISLPWPVRAVTLRRQERSVATRQDLIVSARAIFVRDGFEAARLEDIAVAAGRTRGAFYNHFQNKEDVFFAIFEDDVARDHVAYLDQLRKASTLGDRVAILVKQLESIIRDKARVLLYIEFKMYAIRHPHKRKRLAELHLLICTHATAAKLDLLPELQSDDPEEQRALTAQFGSFFDGLVLNHYFDPDGLDEAQIRERIECNVRALMDPASSWRKKPFNSGH
jgi:AcrR family transcriptional regulator